MWLSKIQGANILTDNLYSYCEHLEVKMIDECYWLVLGGIMKSLRFKCDNCGAKGHKEYKIPNEIDWRKESDTVDEDE